MKKTLLILSLLIYSISNAQIVNIPDTNFKQTLLSNNIAKDSNGNFMLIDTNNDGEIQVSEAQAVFQLEMNYKNISDLTGIEEFVNLTNLDCWDNQITSLDLSNNTNLTWLQCYNNQLTSLDVSNNTLLTDLHCWDNQLTSLDVSNNANLAHLYCYSNQITSLDVSNNTDLVSLQCSSNQLTSLDVSDNTNLTNLGCSVNQLTSLNVSNNTDLVSLRCYSNQLTSLDVSNNTDLTLLWCSGNQLTSLDVSNNTYLTYLRCSYNQLTSLDVSNNTDLVSLQCSSNQLTSLDVSNNINLTNHLWCGYNQLTSLDVSNNTNLTWLSCWNNQLTSLDVSNNTNLTSLSCNTNQLTSLDVSNNTNLTSLSCNTNQLTSLDVSNNTNLTSLSCNTNQLISIDVSNNINLTSLWCDNNQLTSLDVSNNTDLVYLRCSSNQLTSLDVSNNTNLTLLECSSNQLTSLDVSNNINLTQLECSNILDLSYINLKNGNNENVVITDDWYTNFENLPNLQSVCVDEINTDLTAYITTQTGHAVTFTEYCSFEPAQSNTITGNVYIDLDNNGCDSNDTALQSVLISTTNGTESFGTFVLADASYSLLTNEGDFTTSVTTNLPSYYIATPTNYTNTFTGFDNSFTSDFCITPNQTVNDINISIIPTTQARPGFNTHYQIVYKNVGTTQLSGNINLTFDETKVSFLNASETVDTQTSNSLTFNYSNLNPFETRAIDLTFNVNTPTATQPVNIGDVLSFTAAINPISGDYTMDDNTFTLDQTVIGSYDPNDITCLEGNQVLFADKDKYLHYVIRFQNTGTASAINIVVKNLLDTNLDCSTLQLENLSHNNRVAIKNGNEVEFIFENINLPDTTTNEPNSHGFIAYKIKPKTDIALNDVILNKANIFFDYNAAIETNIASTRIVDVLAVNETNTLNFLVYPIPTNNILTIKSKTTISKIEIYSKLGQLILNNNNQNSISISKLSQGVYFVKVVDVNGNFGVKEVIKK